jgi:CubicO group peptidase (beta-lactamase class C family)
MPTRLASLLVIVLSTAAIASDPFPPAKPESVGLVQKDLDALAEVVAGFIKSDSVVGGELHIIKDGHTVLRREFGMKDRDRKQEMPTDAICCIRSMTKPVVGVAIQMLADDGKLTLDHPVAKYLPAFDNDKSKAITIQQLLTHTGGLKLSTLSAVGFGNRTSVRELVDVIGENGPEFKPGGDWHYSDDGADTLTAVVAAVSGKAAEQFLQERILDPLGMADTICVLKKDDPRIARIATAYAGSKGAWFKLFAPGEKPIFPFFLGSQGMYSTTENYARFLKLIADGGTWEGKRLLSKEAVARILTPARETPLPTGFDGRTVGYGQLMMLYQDSAKKVRGFGHNGSDGTHAYAIPEKGLFVFYFTQSRGTLTGADVEKVLHRRLIEPGKAVADVAFDPKAVTPYLGLYWMNEVKCPVEVVIRDGALAIEFPFQTELELKPTGQPAKWVARQAASITIEFQRDEKAPAHTLVVTQPGATLKLSRLKPEAGLPTVEDVLKLRAEKQGTAKLAQLGAVRMKATLNHSTKKDGTFEAIFDGLTRYRMETNLGGRKGIRGVDGEKVWIVTADRPPTRMEGELAEQARLDHPAFAAADWRPLFETIEVLKRIEADKAKVLVIRAVPKFGRARFLLVDEASGQLVGDQHLEIVPGVGRVGKGTEYRDFKDVDGVQLPTRVIEAYTTPLLGRFEKTFATIETKVEVPAGRFAMPKEK